MKTPTTFTEQDARTMLDVAAVHTLSFNPATQQYTCTIQIELWSPVVTGTGPRMLDAVWAACVAATDAATRPDEI
jgi:hypothetical protein